MYFHSNMSTISLSNVLSSPLQYNSADTVKAVTAVFDIINVAILNLLLRIDDEDETVAILALVAFVVVTLLYLATSALLMVCQCYNTGKCFNWKEWIKNLLRMLGLTLYIYGNNVGTLTEQYGEDFGTGCGTDCRRNLKLSARAALAIGALITVIFSKGSNKENLADEALTVLPVCAMLGLIVDFDALYTLFAGTECSPTFNASLDIPRLDVLGSVSLNTSYVVIAVYALVYAGVVIRYTGKQLLKSKHKVWIVSLIVLLCIICWCHLLADNMLPLDCALEDEEVRYTTKLALSTVALVLIPIVVAIGVGYRLCHYKEYNELEQIQQGAYKLSENP